MLKLRRWWDTPVKVQKAASGKAKSHQACQGGAVQAGESGQRRGESGTQVRSS